MYLHVLCLGSVLIANVQSGINFKIGLILGGETSVTRKTDNEILTVQYDLNIREPYQIVKAVHDLDGQEDVDVIVVFDRDWSGSAPIQSTKTFILWNLRPSFTIPRQDDQTPSVEIACTRCKKNSSRFKKSEPTRERPESRKKRSSNCPYCVCDPGLLGIPLSSDDIEAPTVTVPMAVADLIVRQLSWKYVIILHESATEKEVAALVDKLSKKSVLFVIYNIDISTNIYSVLDDIYSSLSFTNSEINFAVLCRINCIKRILNTANTFDCKDSNHKTLLKMISRWLVAVYDHTRDASHALAMSCAPDLDNVAIVAFPEFNDESSLWEFENTIKTGANEYKAQTAEQKTNATLKEFLTEYLKQKGFQWNAVHKCRGFMVDTLLWTSSGREFRTVGYITGQGDSIVKSDLFPNSEYGYNGEEFLVGTLAYEPFVYKRIENGTIIYEGLCMDLLKELARKLNFTYKLMEPEDKKWGSFGPNLTFNGLIGLLQRKEVDMVAAEISIQKERDMVMDFAFPFYYTETSVLIKKPDPKAKNWKTLIDPFHWHVLMTIVLTLLAVSFLIFLMEKYNPYYYQLGAQTAEENRLGTFIDAFWYMYGALLSQGGVHLPDSVTGRTFVSCWWLFCIVIVGTYCGNLIAFLTVTKSKAPFNTLEEMAKMKNEYKWGLLGGTHWENIFVKSTDPAFRAVGDLLIEFNKTDPSILSVDVKQHRARVKKGGYAWIGDTVAIEIALAEDCDLMMIKEKFLPLKYAFGFPDKSPHTKKFSEKMIAIHESGLIQVWKRKWWPKASVCKSGVVTEQKAISITDVQSAFYVAVGGAVLGFLAFLTEIIVAKVKQCRRE